MPQIGLGIDAYVNGKYRLCGDAIYDLAKVYQSICGYDFILVGRQSDSEADQRILGEIKQCFARFVQNLYPKIALCDVILVTASLYFSLIPLHDNLDHHKLFFQKAEALVREHKDQYRQPTWTLTSKPLENLSHMARQSDSPSGLKQDVLERSEYSSSRNKSECHQVEE